MKIDHYAISLAPIAWAEGAAPFRATGNIRRPSRGRRPRKTHQKARRSHPIDLGIPNIR